MFHFYPFPELKTKRLLLRQVVQNDTSAVMKIRGDETAMRYIPRPRAKTKEDALAVIEMLTNGINEGKSINWAICNIENPAEIYGIMGYVNFYPEAQKAEIGYMLHPDYWGKGYVPEALPIIEQYGFEALQLKEIEAKIDPRNENSRKILLRNGYHFERLEKNTMVFEGEEIDSEYYVKTYMF